jgi:hypothetical protein
VRIAQLAPPATEDFDRHLVDDERLRQALDMLAGHYVQAIAVPATKWQPADPEMLCSVHEIGQFDPGPPDPDPP